MSLDNIREEVRAQREQLDAIVAEIEDSRYWVLTVVYPIRGAVHYTCKTKAGVMKAIDDISNDIPNAKFYFKSHQFFDA